ncbi:MAG: MraZ protein [Saprospiraceae bacterium]|jgi:MraZ protein
MPELLGEFECKIDAKGRIKMPTSILKQLGGVDKQIFVINRGVEPCLTLYPKKVWDVLSAKVKKLNPYIEKNRKFIRYFYRGATELIPDSSERILISKSLLEYAGIEKDAVLFAINDRLEVWSKSRYFNVMDEEPENFSELGESVMGQVDMNDLFPEGNHDEDKENSDG